MANWIRFERVCAATLVFGFAALCGCATTQVQPEEMSAEGHRKEAAKEREHSAEHKKQYDPKAEQSDRPMGPTFPRPDPPLRYNPTEWHRTEAEKLSAHAREHEKAASQLSAFEESQCKGFAPATRAACPAMVPVTEVEDIDGGVRLRLAPGTDVETLVVHMQCHLAYARVKGFTEAPDCPLYIKGVAIRMSKDAMGVEIVATDPAVTPDVRKRARAVAHIER